MQTLLSKKNGAFDLRLNPLTTPPYGPLDLFPITSSGVNGAGKSTIERALGLTLEIPHSTFYVDCQVGHTTNGIHFSGRSDDGLVLFDSEGENLSSPADDSALKGLLALLQPITHIHVANGCLQDSDIQRLEVLAHHLKENRVVIGGDAGTRPKGIFFLRTNRRLTVNGKEMTPDEYVTSMIPQSVKDAFDSVECFLVPDDPMTAQQCLSDDNFTPENFPKFHTAIGRIAEIIRAAKSERPAHSTLSGNELVQCLQLGWPSILEGHRAHVPTLREMVVRDRLTGIANSVLPQLEEQLAPVVANPLSTSIETAVMNALQATREIFDNLARELIVDEIGLQVISNNIFALVVEPVSARIQRDCERKREVERERERELERERERERERQRLALQGAVSAAFNKINQAKSDPPSSCAERIKAALATLKEFVQTSNDPSVQVELEKTRAHGRAIFDVTVRVAKAKYDAQREVLANRAPESKSIPVEHGQGFTGRRGDTTILYNLKRDCPEAFREGVKWRDADMIWQRPQGVKTARYRLEGPVAIESIPRNGDKKGYYSLVTWDGTRMIFKLGSWGWGKGGNGNMHYVHQVVVHYQVDGLYQSGYEGEYVAPSVTF